MRVVSFLCVVDYIYIFVFDEDGIVFLNDVCFLVGIMWIVLSMEVFVGVYSIEEVDVEGREFFVVFFGVEFF